MPPLLAARGLSKTFGSGPAAVRAVVDVTFDVEKGEVAMIMGPSGSGKSTLLLMLGLLLRPDAGTIALEGLDASTASTRDLPRLRREHLGFVFQNFLLIPSLTARENVEVAAGLAHLGKAEARRRSDALLGRLGVASRADALPSELSGGEKQRVALARALVNGPRVILADEPTANLDSASGRRVVELLREVAREGRAVVVVSHDERICPFTDRMWRMEDGRISPAEVPR